MKPEPILNHMPTIIKEMIVDRVDTWSKYSLRSVSKEYKQLVDESAMHYGSLLFYSTGSISLNFFPSDPYIITANFEGLTPTSYSKKVLSPDYGLREKYVENESYEMGAAKQLAKILKNPKATLKRFEVCKIDQQEVRRVLRLLEGLLDGQKIFAKSLLLHGTLDQNHIISVLSMMNPEYLEDIRFRNAHDRFFDTGSVQLDEVVHLEQWKNAKEFRTFDVTVIGPFPASEYVHFKEIDMQIEFLHLESVKTIVQSEKIQKATIRFPSCEEERIFGYLKGIGQEEQEEGGKIKFKIPKPDGYLEVVFDGGSLDVKKIKV